MQFGDVREHQSLFTSKTIDIPQTETCILQSHEFFPSAQAEGDAFFKGLPVRPRTESLPLAIRAEGEAAKAEGLGREGRHGEREGGN
jgi:hypothetical protein